MTSIPKRIASKATSRPSSPEPSSRSLFAPNWSGVPQDNVAAACVIFGVQFSTGGLILARSCLYAYSYILEIEESFTVDAIKQLPWRSLFLAAVLAVIIAKALDFVAAKGLSTLNLYSAILNLLATPTGGLLIFGCGGLAIGALGVLCLERLGKVRFINANILWALILCLLIMLWLLSRLLSQFNLAGIGFAQFSEAHLMGIVIGVFWKGQNYWRRF
jgi:hypothetical protein